MHNPNNAAKIRAIFISITLLFQYFQAYLKHLQISFFIGHYGVLAGEGWGHLAPAAVHTGYFGLRQNMPVGAEFRMLLGSKFVRPESSSSSYLGGGR
jgi:hypothetical protein